MEKTKVFIIQKSFSFYRKAIFDRLSSEYNLTVLHSRVAQGIRQIQTSYSKEIRHLKYWKKNTTIYLFCMSVIRKERPQIVIHEFTPSILSIFVVLFFRRFYHYKLILWGHGLNRSKSNDRSLSIYLRKYLIKKADAVLLYGDESKQRINSFIPSKKYFVAFNSLDTEGLLKIFNQLQLSGFKKIKEELCIKYKYNIVFIGRLLEAKLLINYFLKIIKGLNDSLNDLGIIIIGDGPEKNTLIEGFKSYKIDNYTMTGAIHDELMLGKYLFISDLMLMPGYVGLAVNHAFSFNIPVVSFKEGVNGPYHSPEIEYLISGETGYLAKAYNIKEITSFIVNYLENKELQAKMKKNIRKCIDEKCNISNMKKGFVEAINYSLASNE